MRAYLLTIVDGQGATFTYAPAAGRLTCKLSDVGSLYGKMLQWRDKGYTISPLPGTPLRAWLCFPPDSDHGAIYTAIEGELARLTAKR